MAKLLFINNDGGGFADHLEVSANTSVERFFAERMPGRNAGDYLIRVNRQPVPSVDRFAAAVRAARKSGQALLLVRRGEASQFVVVRFSGQGQENG